MLIAAVKYLLHVVLSVCAQGRLKIYCVQNLMSNALLTCQIQSYSYKVSNKAKFLLVYTIEPTASPTNPVSNQVARLTRYTRQIKPSRKQHWSIWQNSNYTVEHGVSLKKVFLSFWIIFCTICPQLWYVKRHTGRGWREWRAWHATKVPGWIKTSVSCNNVITCGNHSTKVFHIFHLCVKVH